MYKVSGFIRKLLCVLQEYIEGGITKLGKGEFE